MVEMIYVKIHNTDKGAVLAMCDAELIDKVLSEGDVEINIRDYADFYKGDLMDEGDARSAISAEEVYSANVIGASAIGVAVEKSIVDESNVMRVGGVPYAQAFNVKG